MAHLSYPRGASFLDEFIRIILGPILKIILPIIMGKRL
jgi:hypothetical protein